MASDQSVPLSKALERFSDPSDWHELRSLEPHATAMLVLDGGGGVDDHLHGYYHYHALRERLEAELLDKLITCYLVATGEVSPRALDREPQVIPGRLWQELKPDFAASEATDEGLRIVRIRVEIARPSQRRRAEASEPREHTSLAKLRVDLRRWLEEKAAEQSSTWCKKDYLTAARKEVDAEVTDNLFKEVWRSAKLPAALRKPGLRKSSVRSVGSSPRD